MTNRGIDHDMTQTGGTQTGGTRTGDAGERRAMPGPDRSRTTIAELSIAAEYRQVRLARLLAGGVAAQLGLDVDRVENVRLTVDELCAVMLECAVARDATDDRLAVTFELESASEERLGTDAELDAERDRHAAASLVVTVRRRNAVIVDEPSAITASILDTTCSTWSVSGTLVRAALRADALFADPGTADAPDTANEPDTADTARSVAADGA